MFLVKHENIFVVDEWLLVNAIFLFLDNYKIITGASIGVLLVGFIVVIMIVLWRKGLLTKSKLLLCISF